MKTIVLASNNKNKIKEFKEIFSDYNILSLNDIGFNDEIEETGETFLENAVIKAKTIHLFLKEKNFVYDVVSDDSGLCVEALNGAPGVYSARYAGIHGNDNENIKKLLKELEGKDNRKAYFICSIVLYKSDGKYYDVEGKSYGIITNEKIGDDSFGYDPVFLSDDLGKTFGEASADEKNKVSHRGRAIDELKILMDNIDTDY